MTDTELDEVAGIITHALITYKADRGMDREARGRHIINTLAEHGWMLIKENE